MSLRGPNSQGKSVIIKSLAILPKNDRARLVIVSTLQILLGFLDLLGVAIIGILGSLAITGIQSKSPGNRVSAFLSALHMEEIEFQNQVAILGLLASIILISRTIISIVVTKKIYFFLSRRSAYLSASLTSRLLSRDLLFIQKRSSQQILFSLTSGVNAITLGILGNATTMLSDASLLIIMLIGLVVVDPLIAFSTFLIFGLLGVFLYFRMNKKAQVLGSNNTSLNISSNQQIVEILDSYRELFVRNRRSYYSNQIAASRERLASTTAELQFMPNLSKYVIESGVVLGAILVSGMQFLLQDASHAIATLSVFLASGTRIAPAIMRLQHGGIILKSNVGSAETTLTLIDELRDIEPIEGRPSDLQINHIGFIPEISISNVNFAYPASDKLVLNQVSLKVEAGELIAIVGPSGAGKTTLVDVLIGVLNPNSGVVEISGLTPLNAIAKWPGAIAYVPQNVTISNLTLKENVVLGFPDLEAHDKYVWDALRIAHLDEYVSGLPEKLNSIVGERGSQISGGQRQRLGIARALFTKPKLLVLDEATSALDGKTEADISSSILELKGEVTVVMIAHRLSTVRNADKVVYMKDGQILAVGKFEEIRNQIPDFDQQASLMGL